MKTRILTLLLLLAFVGCSKKEKKVVLPKSTSFEMELFTIESHSYEKTSERKNLKETIETYAYFEGKKELSEVIEKNYVYDETGKLTETLEYSLNKELKHLEKRTIYKDSYTENIRFRNTDTALHTVDYFSNGIVTKSIHKANFASGLEIRNLFKYNYDEDGNLIRKETYDLDGNLKEAYKFIISRNGNETQIERRDQSNNLLDIERKFYSGENLDLTILESSGLEIDSFIYSDNQLIREVLINLHFNEKRITTRTFNENGDLDELKYYISKE